MAFTPAGMFYLSNEDLAPSMDMMGGGIRGMLGVQNEEEAIMSLAKNYDITDLNQREDFFAAVRQINPRTEVTLRKEAQEWDKGQKDLMPTPSKPSALAEKIALYERLTENGKELTTTVLSLLGIAPKDAPVFKQRIKELENELSSGNITQKVFDEKKLELIMGGDKNKGQTNYHIGSIPQDFIVATDENGQITMKVVPGSPTDIANKEAIKAKEEGGEVRTVQKTVVVQDIDRLKKKITDAPWYNPVAGSILAKFFENPYIGAGKNRIDAEALATTIKSSIGFDRLQQMRDESPTGGALGQVSELELITLQATLGSLDLNQSEEQLINNLERLTVIYTNMLEKITRTGDGTFNQKMYGNGGIGARSVNSVDNDDPLGIR